MKTSHLVILKKPYLKAILAGRKTIESRFMKNKVSLFGRVRAGDGLFLKVSSGAVCAVAAVERVKWFENLTPEKIFELKSRYNEHILGSERYWLDRSGCKFGLLVWLDGVKAIEPVRILKKDWRAWVVLSGGEDFGLFDTSIIYT